MNHGPYGRIRNPGVQPSWLVPLAQVTVWLVCRQNKGIEGIAHEENFSKSLTLKHKI